jgi:glycosyltransferase involved in cell wall biosynthesis
VKVLAVIEASNVTGPAKNLIRVALRARERQKSGLGQEFVFAVFHRDGTPVKLPFVEHVRALGLPLVIIRERHAFDVTALERFNRLLGEVRPHVVQTHMIKSHLFAAIARRKAEHRWIAFHHGYTATDSKMHLYNAVNRCTLRFADMVVTVCAAFVPRLMREGVPRRKLRIIHNSVDLPAAPAREPRGVPGTSGRVLCAVGRLSKEKGHADLISAFALLARHMPHSSDCLVIAGTGPELLPLKRLASELGVADKVSFPGHVADVAKLMRSSDVVVLPSHSEGSPNVLLEALAVGTPVVATAVGGVPEIISQGQTGILVPARDPEGLAAAIARVLQDVRLAHDLSRDGKIHVQESFSLDRQMDLLDSVYSEVMAGA